MKGVSVTLGNSSSDDYQYDVINSNLIRLTSTFFIYPTAIYNDIESTVH